MNLGNHYVGMPLKKKRGRPKKDRSQFPGAFSGASQGAPSQFHGRFHGNQPHQEDADDDDDPMVGVSVTGVIEGTFDAGFILSVKIGSSDTPLKGLIFKPGQYVPVTAENDVAPHVQMIRRNKLPSPSTVSTPAHSTGRQGRERTLYAPSVLTPSNQLVKYKGKEVSIVPAQLPPLTGSRGTVVPVVLQPVGSLNGVLPSIEPPPVISQPAHLSASKARLPDHGLPSPRDVMPISSQTPNGSTEGSPATPFEKMIQRHSVSVETGSVNSAKASGLTQEQVRDLGQPLLIQPLQAIRSGAPDQSLSMQQPVKGKMTELLMAVQENVLEKHAADAWHVEQKHVVK